MEDEPRKRDIDARNEAKYLSRAQDHYWAGEWREAEIALQLSAAYRERLVIRDARE